MSRDMTITVMCDGRGCTNTKEIDLDYGKAFDDYETRINKALESAGWYINLDGDYCRQCKSKAMAYWGAK